MSDQEDTATLAVIADPRLYELLFKVVSEAQAAGSIIIITTIIPPAETSLGGVEPFGCMPKSDSCPK